MSSFDVVSKTDLMEVDNAINGVKRQIKQRYDLAGTKCNIERIDNTLRIIADDTMKLTVVNQQHWDRSGPERIVVMESQR